jgi:hypothetical protein
LNGLVNIKQGFGDILRVDMAATFKNKTKTAMLQHKQI